MTANMKTCKKCGTEYPATLEYFESEKRVKSGLSSWCRGCRKEYFKRWQQSERGKEYQRQYYQSIRNIRLKRVKEYYDTINGHLRRVFNGMKARCNNPNCKSYKNYGGRGIKLCFSSDEFVNYVLNELQIDPRGLEIDRINNDGNYEPGNIRFVTHKVNNNNKRNNAPALQKQR